MQRRKFAVHEVLIKLNRWNAVNDGNYEEESLAILNIDLTVCKINLNLALNIGHGFPYTPGWQPTTNRVLKNNYYVELDSITTTLNKSLLIVGRQSFFLEYLS